MRKLVFLIFAITLVGCSGMMVSGGGSAGGVSASSSTGGSSSGSSSVTPPSDIAITGMVREALAGDARVGRSSISVNTSAGVVQLSGTVSDYEAREVAEKLAMRVDGVRAVDNRISVQNY